MKNEVRENPEGGYFSKSRVEAFSDGIFAVIITPLVLELKVPAIHLHDSPRELAAALVPVLPKLLSWMVSFGIVCVIWVNHHRVLGQLRYITHGIFWLNANLLLWCALIPFPTALLGDYANNPVALIVFGVILSLGALAFTLIRWNALRQPGIFHASVNLPAYRRTTRRSLIFGPALYLTGAACSLIHPYISFAIYAFIPVYFIFFTNPKAVSPAS